MAARAARRRAHRRRAAGPELPRLFGADELPSDRARYEAIEEDQAASRLLPIVSQASCRPHDAAISDDHERFLAEIYPARYRKIWPTAPAVPPEFESADVLAALAVSGPFAMYLQHGSTVDDLAARSHGAAGPDDYVIDMTVFEGHPVKPGLLAPGGFAVLGVDGDRLRTKAVIAHGELHRPGDRRLRPRRAACCSAP